VNNLSDLILTAILSRQAAGIVLILVTAALVIINRPFIREVRFDQSRFWRIIARLAAITGSVALIWTTVFDDWLQIIAEPYRLSMKWDYQRVILDPVDPALRAISVALIGLTLVWLACLFARHVGGYMLQFATLIIGAMLWIPLYVMNQRMNAMVVQGAESADTLPETLGLTAFWVVRMVLGVLTIGATLLPAMMIIALIATVVLDLFKLRTPPDTTEADGFFSELGRRATQREDIPLKYFWRPIRRPL
jgi:hypothetical protein